MKTVNLPIVLAIVFIAAVFATCGYERIDAGSVGIKVELFGTDKGVQNVTAVTGGNFYNRWTQEIHEFPTYVQHVVWTRDTNESEKNQEFAVTTRDGMTLSFDVGFDYQVVPERVPAIFMKYRKELPEITNEYLRTAVRNAYNETAGMFDADTLLFRRNKFEATAKKMLIDKISQDFIVVQLGIVGQVRIPPDLQVAINNKIKATQDAQKVENERRTVMAQAQKDIAKARGDSSSLVIAANAKAQAIKINADAEAYANDKISRSLTPAVIQHEWIQRWDGQLSYVSGSFTPMVNIPQPK